MTCPTSAKTVTSLCILNAIPTKTRNATLDPLPPQPSLFYRGPLGHMRSCAMSGFTSRLLHHPTFGASEA